MKRKLKLAGLLAATLLLLAGCSSKNLTEHSPGIWNQIVYYFAIIIRWFGFNGSQIAVGIILFTLVLRTLLLPLMNMQIKSSYKMQDLQPQIKAIQAKYPGKDMASRQAMTDETQKLYADNHVNPYMGCLPIVVQMPFLWALYQALANVDFLKHGSFLWLTNIGAKDPTYILPILAAIFTFLSSWLNMKAAAERNSMTLMMTYAMPVLIFVMAMNLSSGISLYWMVTNAYQVAQTLAIANPFKIQRERDAKVQAVKDKEKARERALKKAKKR